MASWGATMHFLRQVELFFFHPTEVVQYSMQSEFWAALTSGAVDAVYLDTVTATAWLSTATRYRLAHVDIGWSNGVSYGCHPEYGNVEAALNHGLTAFKESEEYAALCAKYPSVNCDTSQTTYTNAKTFSAPEIADHPMQRADIVIGTEADYSDHNYVRNGVLGGFDIELTKAVCAQMGKTCAIVTVPWQSVWTSDHSRFGWPNNRKNYPGEGHHNCWFHCVVGTVNIIARQQFIAFTHPYTNRTLYVAGFVVADAEAATFPHDAVGKSVGVLTATASASYFGCQVYRCRGFFLAWYFLV